MNKKKSIYNMVQVGMFAAVLAVMSQISIPLPTGVPITLQTFAVALTGYILGWKKAPVSVAVFLAIGAVGVPVFSNFSGGFSRLVGPTGGFLWGFLFLAFLCGLGVEIKKRFSKSVFILVLILFSALGLAMCHLLGVAQYAIVADKTFMKSFLAVSAPFLIKDAISVVIAYFIAIAIKQAKQVKPA